MLSRLIDSLGLGDPPKLTGGAAKDVEILAKSHADTKTAILKFLRSLNQPDVLELGQASITATNGIVFPSGTMADYEPQDISSSLALTFATPGDLSVTYTTKYGRQTRIGRFLLAEFNIITSAFTHTTASGQLGISGLADVSSADSGYSAFGSLVWAGITKASYTQVTPIVTAGNNIINFIASGSGVATSSIVAADVPTGGTVHLRGFVVYTD
jgi:hypothetical protein